MTITTHDQLVKIKEFERDGVMFPRGIHQLVRYVFAVEGVAASERSIHQRLIEMVKDGWFNDEKMDPYTVNMSGMKPEDAKAECATLRCKIWEALGNTEMLHAVWAKSCPDSGQVTHNAWGDYSAGIWRAMKRKYYGMSGLVDPIHQELQSGRFRATRSREYVASVLTHVCGSYVRKEHCTVMKIHRKHQVAHQYVSRDVVSVEKIVERLERKAFAVLEKRFKGTEYIP